MSCVPIPLVPPVLFIFVPFSFSLFGFSYVVIQVAGDNGSERCSEGVPRHILSGSKGKSVIPSKDVFQLAGEGAGGLQKGWEER